MLAVVLQSEDSHEMEFDGVYWIIVFTLYCPANWKCPKCGENSSRVFFIPVLHFSAFLYFNSHI